MPFLATAFSWVVKSKLGQLVINLILGKLIQLIKSVYEKRKRAVGLEQSAKASAQSLKEAKTKEEVDRAARDALDNI